MKKTKSKMDKEVTDLMFPFLKKHNIYAFALTFIDKNNSVHGYTIGTSDINEKLSTTDIYIFFQGLLQDHLEQLEEESNEKNNT